VALNVVVAGAVAAGRPPPGSPGLPPQVPASWQGAWVSETSSAQRRSAWRLDHTSGTPPTPGPYPSASAARNRRSHRSDTRRWPHNPPGIQRSEASGPEACSMPMHSYRQGRQRNPVHAVDAAGRKAADCDRQPAVHPPVDLADPGGGRGGLLPVAKVDREGRVQDGAEPAQRVGSEGAVRSHTGRDQRVRKLQQHRGRSGQQQRPLAPGPPDLRVRPHRPGHRAFRAAGDRPAAAASKGERGADALHRTVGGMTICRCCCPHACSPARPPGAAMSGE
jgi:hypothetical protein